MVKYKILAVSALAAVVAVPFVALSENDGFVGGKTCGACHGDVYAAWEKTAHARALDTLKAAGSDQDEKCLGCHVTGGAGTKYVDAAVSCEACHGPGQTHVDAPAKDNIATKGAEADCRACHTADWSPDFDYEKYRVDGIHHVK